MSEAESRGLFYVKCIVQLTTTTAHEHTHIYAWHARRKPVGAEPIFGPGIALHGIVKHLVRNDGPDDANHYALICEHSRTDFFSGWGSALREERLGLS